jgi:hypothetical protein
LRESVQGSSVAFAVGSHPGRIAVPSYDEQRFEALVIYIASRTKDVPGFGRTKLAKVLFFSDFDVYRDHGRPLTGATYIRMPFGPFPQELEDVEQRLDRTGAIKLEYDKEDYEEKRIVVLGDQLPEFSRIFEGWELLTVDHWISEIRTWPARRVSDWSHRHPGWRLAEANGRPIPYATSLLPFERPTAHEAVQAKRRARERGWLTDEGWIWERISS